MASRFYFQAFVLALPLLLGACSGFFPLQAFFDDGSTPFEPAAYAQPVGEEASLEQSVVRTPAGDSGEWGDTVFFVTDRFASASGRSCREVFLLLAGQFQPERRIACEESGKAFFATILF